MGLRRRTAARDSRQDSSPSAARHFRPRIEPLESRCLLASGIFSEDFSSDFDPTRPGYDTNSDGFRIAHQFPFAGDLFFDVSQIPPGPSGDFFSAPHGLFLNDIDHITFPDLLADEFINLARVNVLVGTRDNYVRFIARDGRFLTVALEPGPSVLGIIATSQTLADDGQPLGHIVEMEILGIELTLDDVRVLVTRNFAPQPQDDLATASPREVISIPVLANDISSNFDPLTITAVTTPAHGQVEIDGDAILYVSDQGFAGEDTFEYTVQDTFGETATATVRVQVVGPLAVDDRTVTLPGAAVEIDLLANDTTPGGDDLLTIVGTSDPAGGAATIVNNQVVYTPDAGFHGSDTFTYTLRDPYGNESTATVTVIVNTPPQAADLVYALAHGITGPVTISAPGLLDGASDADGVRPAIVPAVVPLPFGSVSIAEDGSFTVASDRSDGRILEASFPYRVRDEFGFEAVAEVSIAVENALPIVLDPSHVELRLSAVTLVGTLGTDADGDPLLVEVVDPPLHGTVAFYPLLPDASGQSSLRYEYVPTGGLRLNDRFTYRLLDPYGTSELGTFELATNNAAAIANDDSFTVQRDVARALDVTRNEKNDRLDNDPLFIRISRQPAHGTAWISDDGSVLFYRSDPGYEGSDDLTYRLMDGDLVSNEALVVLEVVAPPGIAEPVLADDLYVLDYGRRTLQGEVIVTLEPDPRLNDFIPPDSESLTYSPYIIAEPSLIGIDFSVLGIDITVTSSEFIVTYPAGFTGSFTFAYGFTADPAGPAQQVDVGNTAAVTVRIIDRDTDGDGVLDSVEDRLGSIFDLPADSAQRAYVPNSVTGRHMVLTTEVGVLRNVQAVFDPAHGSQPLPAEIPIGALAFELHDVPPGGEVLVTLHPPFEVDVNTYYKFGTQPADNPSTPFDERTTDHWYDFLYDGQTGADFSGRFVTLNLVDNGRGDSDPRLGIIADPGAPGFVASAAPRVQSVTINDGGAQRSMVNSLTVKFDRLVTIDQHAFELTKIGARKAIDLNVSLSEVAGRTVALLEFHGSGVQHGSLKNGAYRLTIQADQVKDPGGNLLDGDRDGLAGDNFVDEFFRLFGDTDGDQDINRADWEVLKGMLGKRRRDAGYLWYLDFNNNGRVWREDLALFLLGFIRSNGRRSA